MTDMSYRDKTGHFVYTGTSPFSEDDDISPEATEDEIAEAKAALED